MPYYIVIDVGNGAIKAASYDAAGRPETIRSERGGKSWPSFVHLLPNGDVNLGEDAREQHLVSPNQVATGFKDELGNSTKIFFNRTMSASEVVGLAVKKVVDQAQKQTCQKFDGAVVTWPANFRDDMKAGLLEGFKLAGINVVQGVTEPGAAAYAYCAENRVDLLICVDVGHGTTDVSVMEVRDGLAIPVATEGIPKLGGRDFTAAVVKILLDKLGRTAGTSIVRDKLAPEQVAELEEKAEKAKHALSAQQSTNAALHFAGKPQLVEITRDEYEKATAGLVKQILDCTDKARIAAKKTWTDFQMLVVAGGALQSVRIQENLADFTGLVPKAKIDPEVVVAHGAAVHAHELAAKAKGTRPLPDRPQLQETTGHDIGVLVEETKHGSRSLVCEVMVPKGTPVPYEVTKEFRLPNETATEGLIEIVQGPQDATRDQCTLIGAMHLKGLPREQQRTSRIVVTCRFDSNTLCEVTARDKISGFSQTANVKTRNSTGGTK